MKAGRPVRACGEMEWLTLMKTGKMDIGRRMLLTFLAVAFLALFFIGLLFLRGFWAIWENTQEDGAHLSEASLAFAEDMAMSRTRELLEKTAADKAQQVELALEVLREDTQYMADAMTSILTHPERHKPRQLPMYTPELMASGRAYLLVTPAVREDCGSEEAREAVLLSANGVDTLEEMGYFYAGYQTSIYYASKYGHFIGMMMLAEGEEYAPLVTYGDDYNPRQRPWYQRVVETRAPGFTDVYMAVGGFPEITCSAPYYDANGLAGVAGIDISLDALYDIVSDTTLGRSNINFALTSKGEILFSSEKEGALAVGDGRRNLCKASDEGLARAAADMAKGASGTALVELDGEEYYLAYAPIPSEGWSLGTMLKKSEVLEPVTDMESELSARAEGFDESMRSLFIANLLKIIPVLMVMCALFVYKSRLAARHFAEPFLALAEGVGEIAKGNFDKKIDIKTGDEIEMLADAIHGMAAKLKEHAANLETVTAEKQRVATELSLAQGIQESMLPKIFPKFSGNPHYDLAVIMKAAEEVGGNFYDFYMIDDEHMALTVAGVSGKGVPAALFMVAAKAMLKNDALAAAMERGPGKADWAEVMSRVNCQICENNDYTMFMTVFFAVLNLATGELICVNGGHTPPFLGCASAGNTEWQPLRDEGKKYVVGIFEEAEYAEKRLRLHPGDLLFLCTEGVAGAMGADGSPYTKKRLQETLCRTGTADISMEKLLASVQADIDRHVGGAGQRDDLTMLAIRFLG